MFLLTVSGARLPVREFWTQGLQFQTKTLKMSKRQRGRIHPWHSNGQWQQYVPKKAAAGCNSVLLPTYQCRGTFHTWLPTSWHRSSLSAYSVMCFWTPSGHLDAFSSLRRQQSCCWKHTQSSGTARASCPGCALPWNQMRWQPEDKQHVFIIFLFLYFFSLMLFLFALRSTWPHSHMPGSALTWSRRSFGRLINLVSP